jgi:hypothetical protein
VFLGNLILESVTFGPGAGQPGCAGAVLAGRGVEPGPSTALDDRAAQWTSAQLTALSSADLSVFRCDYARDPSVWRVAAFSGLPPHVSLPLDFTA